jgi:glycosyltransferase involved in cell wall biosynthesis
MNRPTPRVSIALPVYNGERFLSQSLDSLLGQTYGDFELLLCDNASTDATEEICRNYAARDRRIAYVRRETNLGMSGNFNQGFAAARGEYFKWAAYDDIHAPEFLARCVEVLDADPTVLWCFPRFSHVDPWGRLLDEPDSIDVGYVTGSGFERSLPGRVAPALSRSSPRPSQRFRSVILGGSSMLDNYALVRRRVMARTSLQLPYYGGDKVLIAELCLHGRFHEIPETLFFARVHPQGSGAFASAKQQQEFVAPSRQHGVMFTRLNLLRGYLRAIRRAGLPWGERTRCYEAVLEYVFQVKKWKRVVGDMLAGKGTGGGYVEAAQRMTQEMPDQASPTTTKPLPEKACILH